MIVLETSALSNVQYVIGNVNCIIFSIHTIPVLLVISVSFTVGEFIVELTHILPLRNDRFF